MLNHSHMLCLVFLQHCSQGEGERAVEVCTCGFQKMKVLQNILSKIVGLELDFLGTKRVQISLSLQLVTLLSIRVQMNLKLLILRFIGQGCSYKRVPWRSTLCGLKPVGSLSVVGKLRKLRFKIFLS